jgi:hypothetical protein
MTIPRDPDEILAAWLDEGPTRLPHQTRRAIVVALPTTSRRRHAWGAPWRFPTMSTLPKLAIGAVAVIAVVLGGAFLLRPGSSDNGVGGHPSTTSSPAPSVAPSPTPFTSGAFQVPIQLTMVDGWTVASQQFGDLDVSAADKVASIFSIASMTVRGATQTDPWVPWPADIHAWLAGRAEFRPGEPRATTIGGRPATVIDVDVVTPVADTGDWVKGCGPQDVTCGINLRGANDSGGWRIHLVVVPTGAGTGIVGYIDAPVVAAAGDFQTAAASFDRLLASLSFR